MLVVLGGVSLDHVAAALAAHCVELRRNGFAVPEELRTLVDVLLAGRLAGDRGVRVAGSGLGRPMGDGGAVAGEGERVLLGYDLAAARLGVSPRTVRRMVADGRLPVVRVRRRRLVPAAAVAALVSSASRAPGAAAEAETGGAGRAI